MTGPRAAVHDGRWREVTGGKDVGGDGRLLSVAQLQAALRRAADERTAPTPAPGAAPLEPSITPVAAPTREQPGRAPDRGGVGPVGAVVLAAHAGAGASTVALGLADATAGDRRVVLVDCAHSACSGLAGVAEQELGIDERGWRRARRGGVRVVRVAADADRVDQVGEPCWTEFDPGAFVVLDVGWPARDVLRAQGWLAAVLDRWTPVVVCRASVPGLHHGEQLLAALDPQRCVLAVTGSQRLPPAARAAVGPQVRRAQAGGRLVFVPSDRRLQVSGLSAAPLPKPILAAGQVLCAAIVNHQPGGRPGQTEEDTDHVGHR